MPYCALGQRRGQSAVATANHTAIAGQDYTAQNGTLTFLPGETSKPIAISIQNDNLDEPDETFAANLTSATSATILDDHGVGLIIDAVRGCRESVEASVRQSCIPTRRSPRRLPMLTSSTTLRRIRTALC